ncbi:hypothetical protein [Salinibacter phage M8CRM-1]|uniref:YspA cpYpsA-related SLOG domain-containing protein n=1 Tax=Salinibacter phage M8CRM-1 TaxID=2681612 RepID=A0A2I6UGN2_9CAUD|nr:GTP-binding domain [Salinibacter phage M8CRM-1]AUO79153.1 hypothetical protein [Salinibacter phage M8CRM-1]
MKVIVAGSRSITSQDMVDRAIEESGFSVSVLVSGGARGVDRMGEKWAESQPIPYLVYPADWGEHGKSAGYIRNAEMAEWADALVAVWDGKSRGTKHMIETAHKSDMPIFVWFSDGRDPKEFTPVN